MPPLALSRPLAFDYTENIGIRLICYRSPMDAYGI